MYKFIPLLLSTTIIANLWCSRLEAREPASWIYYHQDVYFKDSKFLLDELLISKSGNVYFRTMVKNQNGVYENIDSDMVGEYYPPIECNMPVLWFQSEAPEFNIDDYAAIKKLSDNEMQMFESINNKDIWEYRYSDTITNSGAVYCGYIFTNEIKANVFEYRLVTYAGLHYINLKVDYLDYPIQQQIFRIREADNPLSKPSN